MKSTLYSITADLQELASREQARRVTDWRRERRWEMASRSVISSRRWRERCSFTHA